MENIRCGKDLHEYAKAYQPDSYDFDILEKYAHECTDEELADILIIYTSAGVFCENNVNNSHYNKYLLRVALSRNVDLPEVSLVLIEKDPSLLLWTDIDYAGAITNKIMDHHQNKDIFLHRVLAEFIPHDKQFGGFFRQIFKNHRDACVAVLSYLPVLNIDFTFVCSDKSQRDTLTTKGYKARLLKNEKKNNYIEFIATMSYKYTRSDNPLEIFNYMRNNFTECPNIIQFYITHNMHSASILAFLKDLKRNLECDFEKIIDISSSAFSRVPHKILHSVIRNIPYIAKVIEFYIPVKNSLDPKLEILKYVDIMKLYPATLRIILVDYHQLNPLRMCPDLASHPYYNVLCDEAKKILN